MIMATCYILACLLSLSSAITLLYKSEAVRGAGRIVGGLAWICACIAMGENYAMHLAFFSPFGLTVILPLFAGIITVISGVRKFSRRNQPQ